MCEFLITLTGWNQSCHKIGPLTIYTYTVFVPTDAPELSPAIVTFAGSRQPETVLNVYGVPWPKSNGVVVAISSLEPLGQGDGYAICLAQVGAQHYYPFEQVPASQDTHTPR